MDKDTNLKKSGLAALALYASLVIGSILHGGDKLPKGVLIAITAIAAGVFSFFLGAMWWAIPIGTVAACLYWLLFRSGFIAHAELDFMYMADRTSLSTVWLPYLIPVGVAAAIILPAFYFAHLYYWMIAPAVALPTIYVPAWASKKYADYKQVGFTPETERKARRRVELFSACAPSGIYVLLVVLSLSFLVK